MSNLDTQFLLERSESYLEAAMHEKDSHDILVDLQLSLACSQLVLARQSMPPQDISFSRDQSYTVQQVHQVIEKRLTSE